ncbi:MAG: Flp pilus assembly complex ATPase component TadA [Clostridiales bacterium]|nr:Flp pilus assembly complex ATPase component TadA [Clostridiales bacterium]
MPNYRKKLRLGDILIANGAVDEKQLEEAMKVQEKNGSKLGEALIGLGYIEEEDMCAALSRQLGYDVVTLRGKEIDDSLINLVSGSVLRKYTMFPYEFKENNPNVIRVALEDPMNIMAIDDFSIISNLLVEPVIATRTDIMLAIDRYYGESEAMKAAEQYTTERSSRFAEVSEEDIQADMAIESSPIVQLVKSMVEQAARQRASDIHIEALDNRVRIRYRIDGALYEKMNYDPALLNAIIARIKIVSGMDISEKRKPQDGRFSMDIDKVTYDIRVSTLPTVYGEKCVMRLAFKNVVIQSKSDLGLDRASLVKFDRILNNPNGIILVTGPTGSGKSTTLYTVLRELNTDDVNIITVEDPVEANIKGVNQVQVNAKANLTFANSLRSMLRQDPDIIMIGEIRDTETAEIAVQASLTGHLVVSTLHTNSTANTITRLLDMGIQSYLIADSVIAIVAQRLVRRLCPSCRKTRYLNDGEKEWLGLSLDSEIPVNEPVGCDKCNNTGYFGRIGVYEILEMSPVIRELISNKASVAELTKAAKAEGMKTIKEGCIELLLEGTTSIGDVIRVIGDDQKG